MKDAGLSGQVRFQDLRGTFATMAYGAGYSLREITLGSGHTETEACSVIRKHYLATDVVSNMNEYGTDCKPDPDSVNRTEESSG